MKDTKENMHIDIGTMRVTCYMLFLKEKCIISKAKQNEMKPRK